VTLIRAVVVQGTSVLLSTAAATSVNGLPFLMGLSPVVKLVRVWVPDTMIGAQPLEDALVASPPERPRTHMMICGVVNYARTTDALGRRVNIYQGVSFDYHTLGHRSASRS